MSPSDTKGITVEASRKNVQDLFNKYMDRVEHYLQKYAGVSSWDIDDYHYYDNFADGVSALRTAEQAIEYAYGSFTMNADQLTESIGDAATIVVDKRRK